MVQIVSILTILFPIFTFPIVLLGFFMDQKYKLVYLILFALILSIIAYTLEATIGLDLAVYFAKMQDISQLTINEFAIYLQGRTEPIFEVLLYLVSLTGNYHILPIITTFTIYFIYLYIVYDYSKKNNISKKYFTLSIIMILILLRFIYTISGIRNPLAIAIFAAIFYNDVYIYKSKKIKYIFLYIIPFFIHNSIIILVLIRVFALFITSQKNKFGYIKNIIIILLFSVMGYLLLNSMLFIERTDYFVETYNFSFKLLENKDFFMQQVTQILFILINYKLYKINKDKVYLIINIFNVILLLMGYAVFFVFDRYFQLMILFNILSISNYMKINTKHKSIVYIILAIILGFFFLNQIRSIMACKFLIKEKIFVNILKIFFDILTSIK